MAVRAGRYAAIDIGTVTCRMLVADVDASGLHELDREYVITNLGEGVNASGVLKPQAMERVAKAVDDFQRVLARFRTAEHPSIETVAMATSAARDARNAEEFAALLAAHGVTLAVIPGQREAALSFRGASSDFAGEGLLVVDVGGGSTEVVAGRAGADPFMSHSFDIGCRRLTERFFSADPPTDRELAQARAWVRADMEPFFAAVRTAGFVPGRLVAVAGTATSVVSIHERMEVYDAARVHKTVVSRAVLDEVCARLRSCTLEERKQVVGLDPGRAPVIVAGLVILQEVLDLAGVGSFTVSETDILHGMILDAADRERW